MAGRRLLIREQERDKMGWKRGKSEEWECQYKTHLQPCIKVNKPGTNKLKVLFTLDLLITHKDL